MTTARELIDFAKNGRNISVSKGSGGQRQLVISGTSRSGSLRQNIDAHAYDHLMTQLVDDLAARHGSDLTVDVKINYYGSQWVEVRSGMISRRTARLGISPRYISRLQDQIADRTGKHAELV